MRLSVLASNSIKCSKDPGSDYTPLDYTDSVYLATRGGAQLLDMEGDLGTLETGKLADFILVDMQGKQSNGKHIKHKIVYRLLQFIDL